MHRFIVAALGLMTLAATDPVVARGLEEAADLEHARANARAGGPISERDAELLERYGCLTGHAVHSASNYLTGDIGIAGIARIGDIGIE